MSGHPETAGPEHDAALAACLLAVDPSGLGGASVRSAHDPTAGAFLKTLRSLLPAGIPFRRVPLQIADGRLLGGLDLAATLQAGRPVLERGLLADADGGCAVLPMAERLPAAMVARLCSVLDSGEVVVERDGFACRSTSRIAVIALDESASDDERPPAALLDRLALHLNLAAASCGDDPDVPFDAQQIGAARAILSDVTADDEMLKAVCCAAAAIGVASVRAPMFAMKVARIHAALSRRRRVTDADAMVAARLVLAPRATVLPPPAEESAAQSSEQDQKPNHPAPESVGLQSAGDQSTTASSGELEDVVLAATRAAIPPHLLAQLQSGGAPRGTTTGAGRAGAPSQSAHRGRPVGIRRGELQSGARLNIVETLRSAAPWQRLRRRPSGSGRVEVRPADFRITRFKQRSGSAIIFVVDASGSSALHRLAEAKGAVELLLADCYARRDQVALIAFRGKSADLVLPPTRSLARAKRSLSTLPGGGGTPVAAALDAADILAGGSRRKGLAPTIVLLTDGHANIARDGRAGREQAEADARASASRLRAARVAALVVDISPRPRGAARQLALDMGAQYLALPNADARILSQAVQAITPGTTMPHVVRRTGD
jgi:magnesium chelatase subunit D